MSETPRSEESEQIEAAARVVLGLLRGLVEHPGSVEMKALPFLLLEAAEERHRQGDFGAERMLCDWADVLRDWED
ncbi:MULTISPECIES: hypothetical protein [unclassified Paracoccus (in: a-proteobacteria)]|uniref:hypothetical protein n=1 Tax=unclassified Paracoccus (in: a-proteobacteria) TaxID=2688777 RepID=UPI0012B241F7|nr:MULTISPECIES: hypothetical protein [unclassified Paracoccus (in: a-proteobacteria)]UXU73798.1 hypothetical protein GB879_007565 [Paracoccus sp. SMMA_5]UXU79688.1 hypothetical protein GB880_007555 [Paracoccus sp. SMMA_5_TC]